MFDEVLCGSEQRQYYQKSIFVQQIMALSHSERNSQDFLTFLQSIDEFISI